MVKSVSICVHPCAKNIRVSIRVLKHNPPHANLLLFPVDQCGSTTILSILITFISFISLNYNKILLSFSFGG